MTRYRGVILDGQRKGEVLVSKHKVAQMPEKPLPSLIELEAKRPEKTDIDLIVYFFHVLKVDGIIFNFWSLEEKLGGAEIIRKLINNFVQ